MIDTKYYRVRQLLDVEAFSSLQVWMGFSVAKPNRRIMKVERRNMSCFKVVYSNVKWNDNVQQHNTSLSFGLGKWWDHFPVNTKDMAIITFQ